jgi:1-acyl-sn-glycerol-3-phosphate acyltransferase
MDQRLDLLNILKGEYHTPVAKQLLAGKLFPGVTFYRLMIKQVLDAAKHGKHGTLTFEQYYRHGVGIFRAVEAAGGRVQITGINQVSADGGPYVFVANHMSVLETFLFAAILHPIGDHVFVVKKSLAEYPVFHHVILALDSIVVGRENPREDLEMVLRKGVEKLQSGISVVIFPQRTRTAEFMPEKFNTIGIKLAKRAGVAVAPVALKTDFWGQGRLLKDFGGIFPKKTVCFHFGAPITISGKGQEEHERIIHFIGDKYAEWEKAGDR